MRGRTKRLRTALFLGVGIILTGVALAAYAADAFEGPELDLVDARFSVRGDQKPPNDLVLVLIDDVTFDELRLQWPFGRDVHASVVDRIVADGPKVIAYDVQFSERSKDEDADIALAEALLNSGGKAVMSFTEVDSKGGVNLLNQGPDYVKELEIHAGNGLFPTDPGGVIRRLQYAIDDLPLLSVVNRRGRLRQEGRQGRVPIRRRVDRLLRRSRHDRRGPVLAGRREEAPARLLQGQVRRRGPVRADAAGRPPYVDYE